MGSNKGLMGKPATAEQEAEFSAYIARQTARIRASWSEIEHRRRASGGLTLEDLASAMAWRPPTMPDRFRVDEGEE